jgi:hypothetical protein
MYTAIIPAGSQNKKATPIRVAFLFYMGLAYIS